MKAKIWKKGLAVLLLICIVSFPVTVLTGCDGDPDVLHYVDFDETTGEQVDCEKTSEEYIPITEMDTNLSDEVLGGWYAVRDSVTLASLTVSGDVHLILCGGTTLTVEGDIIPYEEPDGPDPTNETALTETPTASLTVYMTSEGGTLLCGGKIELSQLYVKGGSVVRETVTHDEDDFANDSAAEPETGIGIEGDLIIRRGGIVGNGSEYGVSVGGAMTVYGGSVEGYGATGIEVKGTGNALTLKGGSVTGESVKPEKPKAANTKFYAGISVPDGAIHSVGGSLTGNGGFAVDEFSNFGIYSQDLYVEGAEVYACGGIQPVGSTSNAIDYNYGIFIMGGTFSYTSGMVEALAGAGNNSRAMSMSPTIDKTFVNPTVKVGDSKEAATEWDEVHALNTYRYVLIWAGVMYLSYNVNGEGPETHYSVTAEELPDGATALSEGWYYVDTGEELTLSGLTVTGNAHLILRDHAALEVKTITGDSGSALTVYVQSEDPETRGKMTVEAEAGDAVRLDNLTVHGGEITALGADSESGSEAGDGFDITYWFTVYNGEVTGSGGEGDADESKSGGAGAKANVFTIFHGTFEGNGGDVEAPGINGETDANGGNGAEFNKIDLVGGTLTGNGGDGVLAGYGVLKPKVEEEEDDDKLPTDGKPGKIVYDINVYKGGELYGYSGDASDPDEELVSAGILVDGNLTAHGDAQVQATAYGDYSYGLVVRNELALDGKDVSILGVGVDTGVLAHAIFFHGGTLEGHGDPGGHGLALYDDVLAAETIEAFEKLLYLTPKARIWLGETPEDMMATAPFDFNDLETITDVREKMVEFYDYPCVRVEEAIESEEDSHIYVGGECYFHEDPEDKAAYVVEGERTQEQSVGITFFFEPQKYVNSYQLDKRQEIRIYMTPLEGGTAGETVLCWSSLSAGTGLSPVTFVCEVPYPDYSTAQCKFTICNVRKNGVGENAETIIPVDSLQFRVREYISETCIEHQKIENIKMFQTYFLELGGKEVGQVTTLSSGSKWILLNGTSYISMDADGKMQNSKTQFAWNYEDGAFYAEQTISFTVGGFLGIPEKTITFPLKRYLSHLNEGYKLSIFPVSAGLYQDVKYNIHLYEACRYYRNCTHTSVCSRCGEKAVLHCSFDPSTHRCACGAYDPEFFGIRDVWVGIRREFPVYRINIHVEMANPAMSPERYEYSLDGGRIWLPAWSGTVILPEIPSSFLCRVTDVNGDQYYARWGDGR